MGRIIFIFLALHFAAYFIMFFFALLGFYQLLLFHHNLTSDNITTARLFLYIAKPSFAISGSVEKILAFELGLVGKENYLRVVGNLLQAGKEMSLAGEPLIRGVGELRRLAAASLDNSSSYNGGDITRVKAELVAARDKLTTSTFLLEETPLANQKQQLVKYRDLLIKTILFVDIAPQVLGFDEKKTYLVLLQNNMELRPAGGFIGSYGLLSFDRGGVSKFDIYDVYSADGQLRGHVEPPAPIKKYLEQPHWYLRDSNWDPDFSKSAGKAAWFLEKEMGVKVDGVIGIDASLISLVLDAVGGVYLPDYQETVTSDNLFERANYWAHKDFFAGSTGKTDFLGSLSRMLFEKIQNDGHISLLKLLQKLLTGVEEKHLMIALSDQRIQRLISFYDMSGEIKVEGAKKEGDIHDFFMAVDANLGVNKVNYFLKRNIDYSLIINTEGEISTTVKITYTNQNPNQIYKNYLRIFTPSGARLISASFDGAPVANIDMEEGERNNFGFYIVVPAKSQKSLMLTYSLSERMLVGAGQNKYRLNVAKQPGTLGDPLTVSIKYPTSINAQRVEKSPEIKSFIDPQNLIFTTDLKKDRWFSVEFIKK